MNPKKKKPDCDKCDGSGWIINIETDTASRCECMRQFRTESNMKKAGIPRRYSDCTLDNFETLDNKTLEKALKAVQNLIKRFPKNKKGILFMGPAGVGKTHLVVSMLRILINEKGCAGLFIDFQELLRKIIDSYSQASGTTEYQILGPLLNTDLLIIDDVGSKKATEWMRDTFAYIINTRYNEKKLTILTTNYLDEEDTDTNFALEDRIGVRIRSRLYEMCDRIVMESDDFRKVFRKGG